MGLFIKIHDTCNEAIAESAEKLSDALSHPVKTLLLLSGGSSLAVAKAGLAKVSSDQKKLITIAQIDERFGKPGHKDSNWNGVEDAVGGFNGYAGAVNVLQGSETIEEDAAYYNAMLKDLLKKNVLVVGLYGVGADGHIAGILPGDLGEFLKYTDGRLVVNFKGSDFPRITTTSALMRRLDEAVVYACGPKKEKAIMDLKKDIPANEHPAQLIKKVNQVWVCYGKEE